MRIYLAGPFTTNMTCYPIENPNLTMFEEMRHPWCLESFHYFKGQKVDAMRRRAKDVPPHSIFLDSGAFSMFTQGIDVNLQDYADYITENHDVIHTASNLDVIGAGNEQASYDNLKTLEKMGVQVQPVHHARDADIWLERYLAEGYDYIYLGGMVPESTGYLQKWLDHIWGKYLTNPDGTAKVKVHGFGMTVDSLMWRYPWFSVDSTSWIMGSRMGTIYVDLPHRDVKIKISDQSPDCKALGRHFDNFSPIEQDAIRAYIESRGFDAELLRTKYGMRDLWNAQYYTRIQDRRVDRFCQPKAGGLF